MTCHWDKKFCRKKQQEELCGCETGSALGQRGVEGVGQECGSDEAGRGLKEGLGRVEINERNSACCMVSSSLLVWSKHNYLDVQNTEVLMC